MIFSLSACEGDGKKNGNNGETQKSGEEQVSGGELNIPLAHVSALNPLLAGDSSAYYFNKLIFEGLFEFKENLEPSEKLVESYTISKDGTIDIMLRKDVKWHDGESLTAEDVKFTIDTIKYGTNSRTHGNSVADIYKKDGILNLDSISDVVVNGNREISITFSENKSNIIETLTFPIIPSHIFEGDFDKALEKNDYMPIGTGPYKQVKYEKLKKITLEAFNSYWGEKPLIKNIEGRILKDEDLSLTSFSAGQIDATFSLEADWEKYAQDENVKIHEFPSRHFEFLALNSRSSVLEGDQGNAVRKAIAFGINKKAIVDRVYLGHATISETPVNPSSYLSIDDIDKTYLYDAEKARMILESAGFKDEDNDGMYEDEKGRGLSLKLTTNSSNELRVRTLDMISEDLKQIGIEVEKDYKLAKNVDREDEEAESDWAKFESKINSGNFEVVLLGWDTFFTEDLSYMFGSDSPMNFINYRSEQMDLALENIEEAIQKKDKIECFIDAQDVFLEELPYVSLFFTNAAVLSNKKLNGEIHPNYINIYKDIDKWFIPKKYQSETK